MTKTLQGRIKIAQERLAKMDKDRKYFAEQYAKTGEKIYKEMAIETGKDADKLVVLIGEALIQLGEDKRKQKK